ncbi:MAG: hypothetical protein HQL04_04770 [Nitrospirae bacterium]|nr:hypothetical protein [Nitrospirota bacterium]
MEHACWIDYRQDGSLPLPEHVKRVYLGHETCQERLPSVDELHRLSKTLKRRDVSITLVTPFLTNEGITRVYQLIDCLLSVLDTVEVVCSDWGLLYYLIENGLCTPIISRLLSSQLTDPRIIRVFQSMQPPAEVKKVQHIDGAQCVLKYTPPSSDLVSHYRSSWIDKDNVIAYLISRGIYRCEISNVAQGVELRTVKGWSYSLHVPDVLVAVMRRCPDEREDFNTPPDCLSGTCLKGIRKRWHFPNFPVEFFRCDNALYYRRHTLPENLTLLPVNRIVSNYKVRNE